jgi:hypothetical protein
MGPLCANELSILLSGSDRVGTAHDKFLLIALPFLPLRGARPRSLPLRRACDEDGKARPAAGGRGDVDAVAENSERLAHDEETDAQTVALCGNKAGESLEDLRNLFAGDSSARVIHIDPDPGTGLPAANKDATSWFGVLDCIADQISQGGAKKQAFAQYRGVAGNQVDAYAPAQRSRLIFATSLPEHLMDGYKAQGTPYIPGRAAQSGSAPVAP